MTVEFHQNDDAQVSLMEMRFYVPSTSDGDDPVKVSFISKANLSLNDKLLTFCPAIRLSVLFNSYNS